MYEMLQAMVRGDVPTPPVGKTVGFRLVEIGVGEARFEMETGEAHYNPMGTVHGGVLCDIADAAMGCAFASTLEEGESFTTIDLQISYLRPVWEDYLTAAAKVIKRGRNVGLIECEVTNREKKLVAKASSHCMVLRDQMAAGRTSEHIATQD